MKKRIKNIANNLKRFFKALISLIWRFINPVFSLLPILIVFTWVFIFITIKHTDFYYDNYYCLNLIDTIIVSLSLLHYFFCYKNYLKVAKNCIKGMLAIIFLQKIYYDLQLSDYTYYFFYIFVVVMIVIKSIYDNLNNK